MPLSSADPLIIGAPIDWYAAVKRYIGSRTTPTKYSSDDIDYILSLYSDACDVAQMDDMLVVSQMVHETAALTSPWSQPPHNNPAGIGVTGAIDATTGQPVGQDFSTWLEAVQCHVGLLLCYRYPSGEGTESQKRLIRICTSFRPSAPRGVAMTLSEMASKWAADPDYVNKLVAVSAAIEKA